VRVWHTAASSSPQANTLCPPHLLKQLLLPIFVQFYLGDLPTSCVESLASPCVCVWVRVRALCLASCFWPLLPLQKIRESSSSHSFSFSPPARARGRGPRMATAVAGGRVWCRPIIARGRRALIWYCVIPLDGDRRAAL
jgi:hypothetical protein